MFVHLPEVGYVGTKDSTFTVDHRITNVCNLKCWYCFQEQAQVKRKSVISTEDDLYNCVKILTKWAKIRPLYVTIAGGEILTDVPRLIFYLNHLNKIYNLKVELLTNGLCRLNQWEEICNTKKDLHIYWSVHYGWFEHYTDTDFVEYIKFLANRTRLSLCVMFSQLHRDWVYRTVNLCKEVFLSGKYKFKFKVKPVLRKSSVQYVYKEPEDYSKEDLDFMRQTEALGNPFTSSRLTD